MSDFTLPEPLKDQAQTAAPQFTLPTPATHTLTENEKSSGIFEAIQQMSDPEEGRARLIVAKHIADRLGVTTSEVFRDIDNYTQKYYKETRPAKDWLSTVIDEGKIQAGTMKLGNLGYQHARARTQEEADKIWEQIQVVKQSLPSPDTISRNIPVELIKQTYGLMAQMAATVPESWDVGALTALGAVGVGAAVGAPIALGTAIAAYIAGGTGKTEYGNAYLDMIDKGISTDVARSYSYGPGILNGLIEGGQMMTLFKGVPAVSKALDDAAKKTLRNVWISKVLENKATKFIAMRGADIALETAQEVAQESVTMTFDHMAIVFENEARDAGIPDYTIEDVKTRIGEIAKQSAMGFTGLSLLGAGVRGSINAGKKAGEKGKAQVTAQDKAQVTTEATTGTQALTVDDREAELDTILKALETNPADKDLNAKRIQVSDELDALEEAKPIEIQEPATMPNLTGDDWLAKKRMEAENSLDTEADWTPSEVLRYKILDSFQGVDESNVDALTSFVDLVAKNQGMTGDQFLSKNFTPEIITKDKAEGSIAQGENRGGMTFINEETGEATPPLDWANLKVSKALMHVGPGSDVSTFFHEFTHAVVGVGLNDEQRGILETAYSKPLQDFTIADLEDVAAKAEAYFASGESPTPELRSLYEKIRDMITRFIARLQGTVQLSPELKAFYDSLVTSKPMTLMQGNQTNLAPNGKPSNLTPFQWKQVRTEAFKNWFGDWENDPDNASKIVDENGEPLVVYHGTPLILNPEYLSRYLALLNDPNRPYGQEFRQAVEEIEKTYPATYEQNKFDIFDLSRSGDVGAHFTEDKTVARKFADSSSGEGTVLEVYLNIRDLKETGDIFSRYQRLYEAIEEFRDNELITDAEFESLAPTAEKLDNKDYDDDRDWGTSKGVINFWKRINKYLTKKKGNVSGIEYRNTVEGGGTSYVAFSPAQIKSATGNTGTFDPTNPSILFQGIQEQRDESGNLIAPNGKPSNLTPFQWKQVRTEAFKSWFGDWENDPANASKVVDENGEPAIVYHGTDKEFDVFNPTDNKYEWKGIFFSFDRRYAERRNRTKIVEAYLDSRKPADSREWESLPDKIQTAIKKKDIATLGENGYDSVIQTKPLGDEIAVFSPTQIKSATGNTGTFDPNNPNILYQPAPPVESQEFKDWFGDSKVVDAEGKPLVVYHGGASGIKQFRDRFIGTTGSTEGRGFYFTDAKQTAEGYKKPGGELYSVYLRITKPLPINQRKLTDAQIKAIFKELLKTNPDALSNYGDIEFDGEAKVLREAIRIEKDAETDLDILSSMGNGGVASYSEVNRAMTKVTGYDGVINNGYAGEKDKPFTVYVAFTPEQIKSVNNRGTFDPNNPNILYQPGDSELVRKAVEQNEWVDDELLSRFASEEWASDEIKKRAMDRRTAGEYEDMDEFIRDSIALSIDPTNDEILYYAQLWKTRDLATETIPASREEQNRNFVASLDKPGLEAILSAIAGANQEDLEGAFGALGHGLFASAIKTVMKGGHISDAHYKKLMDQVNYNPTSFRESVYSLLDVGDEYLAFMEEVSTDPTLAELEKRKQQLSEIKKELATKNLSIESATQEIERANFYIKNLENKAFALDDALSSAQEEAKKGEKSVTDPYVNALSSARAESRMAVSRAKREKAKEIRNFYRMRDAMQKMIKVIMAPPSKSMNYEYQKRLLDLQAGYTKGLGKRGTQARQEMLQREITPEIRAELEKELSAVNVKKMTFEQLEELSDKVKGIRQAGIDAQKVKILNEMVEFAQLKETILTTLQPFTKEAVRGKTSKTGTKEIKSTLLKNVQFSTLTPERVSELLDGGKEGIFHKLLIEEVNGVTDDALRGTQERLGKLKDAMNKYGIKPWNMGKVVKVGGYDYTRHQILGFYIQNQNVDSRKALIDGDNLTEQDVYTMTQILTPEERAFADELMDIVGNDQEFQRLEIAVGENRNELMEQVEKYFPMLRLNKEGTASLEKQVQDELLDRSGKGMPSVRFGGRISRVHPGKKNQTPIRHDVINVASQQIEAQEKYIAMQGHIKKLGKVLYDNDIREALSSAYGDKAPAWMRKYADDLAIPNFYNDQISRTSKMLRSNAAVAYLAFNALTILKQLPSLAFYLADAGPVAMISASGEFLSHPIQTVKLVRSLDPQMASRSFDRVMEELKTMDKSGYERAVKKVGQWGMAGIMMMDTVATTIGWKAVYNKEMSIHADPVKAMRRAQEVTMRTQPSSRVQNLAEIYRSNEGLNWILMFTNQLNKIWNIASFDIPQAWNNGEFGKAGAYAFSIAISGIAMGMIARKDIPDEPEDVGQAGIDILAQLLSSIPVVGGNIVQGASGWGSTGVDPLPMFSQLGATGKTIVDPDKDMEQKLESTLKLILEGCVAAGIPQIATKRSIKAFFDDTWDLQFDPWELIGGHPEE